MEGVRSRGLAHLPFVRVSVCLCVRTATGFWFPLQQQRPCIMNGATGQQQCRRHWLALNTRRLSLHLFSWALRRNMTHTQRSRGKSKAFSVSSFTSRLTWVKLLFALEPVGHSVIKCRPKFCFLVEKRGEEKEVAPIRLHLPVRSVQPVYTGCC